MTRFTRRRVLGVGLGAGVGAGLVGEGGPTWAMVDLSDPEQPDPVSLVTLLAGPPGTESIWIPAASFRGRAPGGSTMVEENVVASNNNVFAEAIAGLLLPAGTTVKRIDTVSYMHPSASTQNILFRAFNMTGEAPFTIASTTRPAPMALGYVSSVINVDHAMSATNSYSVMVSPTSHEVVGRSGVVGVKVHYIPRGRSFVPVSPFRVFDSRWAGFGGPFTGGMNRIVSVADARVAPGTVSQANAVPTGARAITFNLTITGASGTGLVSITPGSSATFTTSTLNWTGGGIPLANASTVALAGNREIKVFCDGAGASAHVIVDVTGYYV